MLPSGRGAAGAARAAAQRMGLQPSTNIDILGLASFDAEGDDVIVRAQPWGAHGAIGVVVIEEEITVKTVLHRRTGVRLKPENQRQGYPVIRLRPEQHVRLIGQVIAVFRHVSA
jgi:SOS-response transcriptional repressor LexA